MLKILTFLTSFLTTILICVLANAREHVAVETGDDNPIIVAAQANTPGKLIVEPEKILRYQQRHHYTLLCDGTKYGTIDYHKEQYKTRIVLLSGQEVVVDVGCVPYISDPIKAIYVYQRVANL